MKNSMSEVFERVSPGNIEKILGGFVVAGFVLLVGAITLYAVEFMFRRGSPEEHAVWGQFGDFLGGTVNPILAFMSLVGLLFTVALQAKQLEFSRLALQNSEKELSATRVQLENSTRAQQQAANAMHTQARYAAISAKLAAMNAALAVATESLEQTKSVGVLAPEGLLQKQLAQKEELAGKILDMTDGLLRDAG